MSLNIVQKLIEEASVIILEVYGLTLTELGVFLDVLVSCARVLEAGELHVKV